MIQLREKIKSERAAIIIEESVSILPDTDDISGKTKTILSLKFIQRIWI